MKFEHLTLFFILTSTIYLTLEIKHLTLYPNFNKLNFKINLWPDYEN